MFSWLDSLFLLKNISCYVCYTVYVSIHIFQCVSFWLLLLFFNTNEDAINICMQHYMCVCVHVCALIFNKWQNSDLKQSSSQTQILKNILL